MRRAARNYRCVPRCQRQPLKAVSVLPSFGASLRREMERDLQLAKEASADSSSCDDWRCLGVVRIRFEPIRCGLSAARVATSSVFGNALRPTIEGVSWSQARLRLSKQEKAIAQMGSYRRRAESSPNKANAIGSQMVYQRRDPAKLSEAEPSRQAKRVCVASPTRLSLSPSSSSILAVGAGPAHRMGESLN